MPALTDQGRPRGGQAETLVPRARKVSWGWKDRRGSGFSMRAASRAQEVHWRASPCRSSSLRRARCRPFPPQPDLSGLKPLGVIWGWVLALTEAQKRCNAGLLELKGLSRTSAVFPRIVWRSEAPCMPVKHRAMPPKAWSPGYLMSTSSAFDLRTLIYAMVFRLGPKEPWVLETLL